MKQFLFLIAIFVSVFSNAQTLADPAISHVGIITITGDPVEPSLLAQNDIVQLQMRIVNNNSSNIVPAGSMKLKIGLGSKAKVDPAFIIANAPLSNYFNWTSTNSGGQVEINGELIANLPANFSQLTQFRILGYILGKSTITINFLVTNHNTNNNLSDENGSNNFASLEYLVNPPLPLTFREILLKNIKCKIDVVFNVEDEVNVSRYQIEASKDGINFSSVGTLQAKNLPKYTFSFPISTQYESPVLFVRIKSIDKDGSIMYSNVSSVSGKCASSSYELSLFPNPIVANKQYVTLLNNNRSFKGEYTITILDIAGKTSSIQKVRSNNQNQMQINVQSLSTGGYFLRMEENAGGNVITMKFQKL
jgi:hypothetical protein